MHSLYFGCALDVVRFLGTVGDGEVTKPLGWDSHPPMTELPREDHVLPMCP